MAKRNSTFFFFFKNSFYFFKYFIYLFLERGTGREKERERNINVWLPLMWPPLGTWPATQACALTGNRTGYPLVHSPHSVHWATPTRAGILILLMQGNLKIFLVGYCCGGCCNSCPRKKCFPKSGALTRANTTRCGTCWTMWVCACVMSYTFWPVK